MGRLNLGLQLVNDIPDSIQKVRKARRGANRVFVGTREVVRNVGRVTCGPLWNVGETVLSQAGKLFTKRGRGSQTLEAKQLRRDQRQLRRDQRKERRQRRRRRSKWVLL